MRASEFLVEYYNISGDKMNQRVEGDTRRPKLTLKHLGKLRNVRELRRMESKKRMEYIPKMYKSQPIE